MENSLVVENLGEVYSLLVRTKTAIYNYIHAF